MAVSLLHRDALQGALRGQHGRGVDQSQIACCLVAPLKIARKNVEKQHGCVQGKKNAWRRGAVKDAKSGGARFRR
jgi:hypothetical protein